MAHKHPPKRIPRALWGVVDELIRQYEQEQQKAVIAAQPDIISTLMERVKNG
jgi:hypothetical protein